MSVPIQLQATATARRRLLRRLVIAAARLVRWVLMALGLFLGLPAVVSVSLDRLSAHQPDGGASYAHVCTQPPARH